MEKLPRKYHFKSRMRQFIQCNDIFYDMNGIGSLEIPAMPNLRGMLNVVFFVESDTDRRSCLYIDSVIVSGDWD